MMIDSQQRHILLSAGATSTTSTATGAVNVNTTRFFSLYVHWTPGTNANVLTLKIETAAERSDETAVWVQDDSWTLSSTHYTSSVNDLQITASGTSQHVRRYDFTVNAEQVRVKYDETVSAGTLTLKLLAKSV